MEDGWNFRDKCYRISAAKWWLAFGRRLRRIGGMLRFPRSAEIGLAPAELVLDGAIKMAAYADKAFRDSRGRGFGISLRPGADTPLWNELRAQLKPYLRYYGQQSRLARLLSLPRQRVNAYVTGGKHMPNAEHTLQLLAWLDAKRSGRTPWTPRLTALARAPRRPRQTKPKLCPRSKGGGRRRTGHKRSG